MSCSTEGAVGRRKEKKARFKADFYSSIFWTGVNPREAVLVNELDHELSFTGPCALTPPNSNYGLSDRCDSLHRPSQTTQMTSPAENEALLYPTDAKMREKERKKQMEEEGKTKKPKKIAKPVEERYDDLGDDLRGLGDDIL